MIGIVMGSASDLDTMRSAAETLEALGVSYEMRIISAHRRPDATLEYARTARARGVAVIIAGAGGAAHLPGVLAAATTVPVLGVPIASSSLGGTDALHSIVQMPRGIPVGTLAIGASGAANAALFAAAIVANSDEGLQKRLEGYRGALRSRVEEDDQRLVQALASRPAGTTLEQCLGAAGFKVSS